jgi:adenosylcobinamide amidohydrolase
VTLRLLDRWLIAEFSSPHRVVSWAIANGGIRTASKVGWYFVERDELKLVSSPARYLRSRMRLAALEDAVAMMTGRRLHAYVEKRAEAGEDSCHVIVTAGLSNALRAGDPASCLPAAGTINILCWISAPLDSGASLEALALVAEARTAAMLDSGVRSTVSAAPATGTGTDCIVIASPKAARPFRYAGKHLVVGHLIGATVYSTMRRAIAEWKLEYSSATSASQHC